MKQSSTIGTLNIFPTEIPIQVKPYSHISIGKHAHDFYELVFVREGFCVHYLKDSVSLAMEGDLFMIKPGMYHKYTGTKECKIFNCLFTPEAFEPSLLEMLQSFPGMSEMLLPSEDAFPHIHLDMMERRHMNELLTRMAKECEERKLGWTLKVRSLLCELMVECSRIYEMHNQNPSEKNGYPNYVTQALSYIDEHYSEESLSVQKLSEHVGISGDYLSRQFRKMTGIAVQEYIRRYRLSRAVSYLQQGYSVGETANLCGFHSMGYFSREFKKEMGIAPSKYENL